MDIILLIILTFIASLIGTITGFGSSTIMVPFVVILMPIPEALLFVGLIHIFNDLWKIILFKQKIAWGLFLSFAIPGAIASIWGARIAVSSDSENLTYALGVLLISYSVFVFLKPTLKLPERFPFPQLGGGMSGFLSGVLGVGGAVRGLFLSAFNFDKQTYLFTSGLIAFTVDLSRFAIYITSGVALNSRLLLGMIVFVPVSLMGAEVAKIIVDKIPEKAFRKAVVIFLLLVGLNLLF